MLERLQKILSARGICSRRKAEEYIEQGLVKVNGKKAILGQKADPAKDTIKVDGVVIEERKNMLYYVMNKPKGVLTSNVAKESETSVRDLLPKELQGKIYPVGRLDKDSSGLLLFTNDGVLAYRLTHPKFNHEKEYEVTVDRAIPNMVLRHLAQGISLKGVATKSASTKKITSKIFRITLTEGRNRQIRRMCQQEGFTVKELKRVRIMTLHDEKLQQGKHRKLTTKERDDILRSVGITSS